MRRGALVRLRPAIASVNIRTDDAAAGTKMSNRDVGVVLRTRHHGSFSMEHMLLVRDAVGWLLDHWITEVG